MLPAPAPVVTIVEDYGGIVADYSARVPWSHGQAVGVGPHRQHYCVELPETVGPDLPVAVAIVARYRGLAGLWDLRVPFPPIDSPAAASGDAHG